MKKQDALRLEAAARDVVEGTDLEWLNAIKHNGRIHYSLYEFSFDDLLRKYEIALAVVEGKPVFRGDRLYWKDGTPWVANECPAVFKEYSWNPPKPRTVLVELLAEDAEWLGEPCPTQRCEQSNHVINACRKALGELK